MRNIKTSIAAIICHRWIGSAIQRIFSWRIPHAGFRFHVPPDGHPAISAYLFWGLYESAERRFVQCHLRPDLDVVELGSSIGVISCHIARQLNASRRLVCVEANPQLIPFLQENLRVNHPRRRVEVLHAALTTTTAKDELVQLAIGESSLTSRLATKQQPKESVSVAAVTLAQILERFVIGDFTMVADIEGAELSIIEHDGQALRRCRQLIIELHSDDGWGGIEGLAGRLVQEHGFRHVESHGAVFVFDRTS